MERASGIRRSEQFGALVPIYGTLATSVIALIIAVPVSFGIALFLTELSPAWLRRPLGTAIELLAAIPSIIYGMWGLFVFAPIFATYVQPSRSAQLLGGMPVIGALFQGPPIGIGMLCAGVILAIMIIPFIAAVMRDVFELMPAAAQGIGLRPRLHDLGSGVEVVLPYTKVGVIGGVMLGLGRALGETMAVTFVIGNANLLDTCRCSRRATASPRRSPTSSPKRSGDCITSALIELGLILFLITFIVLALSKLLLLRLAQGGGREMSQPLASSNAASSNARATCAPPPRARTRLR